MDAVTYDTASLESFRTREPDKLKLKANSDEKHKEKNDKRLNKKRQAFGHTAARSSSTLDAVLSAKLALSRQKEVEIYDSHAVDFGKSSKTKLTDEVLQNAFLPRHLRKRASGSDLSNAGSRFRSSSESDGAQLADDGRADCVGESSAIAEPPDGRSRALSIISESEDKRKGSLWSVTGRKERPHDTLDAFVKFRRDNLDRDRRLKQVQARARVLEHKASGEPIVKSLAYRKKIALPLLGEPQTEAKVHVRKKDRLPHKLPKLKNVPKRDARFDKLLSSLVPPEKRRSDFHRRHYTL